MAKRGPKTKGRARGSDHNRGYHAGWEKIKRLADGMEPTRSKKRIVISKQPKEYQNGYLLGKEAARRYYGI